MRTVNVFRFMGALSLVVAAGACQGMDGEPTGGDTESVDAPEVEIQLGDLEVVSADDEGVPTFANGALGRIQVPAGRPALEEEDVVLRPTLWKLRGALRIDPDELVLEHAMTDNIGDRHYVYKQHKNGLEVIGGALVLQTREGEIYSVHGKARADLEAPVDAEIDAEAAVLVVKEDASLLSDLEVEPMPQMAYRPANGRLELVYRVNAKGVRRDGQPVDDDVLVSATDGSIIGRISHIHSARNRQIHNANNGWSLPGTLARSEGGPLAADGTVNINYNLVGTTYDCYQTLFGRDSLNNAGIALTSSVHVGSSYVNAFWNGSQIAFGDGDGSLSGNLAHSFDVVAHELTHGVTGYTSNLIYSAQSGGLNESMSDIFASVCTWYKEGYAVNANTWKMADDVWTPGTAGDALRYLNDPRADGASLDHLSQYYSGVDVHYSSGIPNLAFYLLAQGGSHPRGASTIYVYGVGMSKAAQIFYRTNTVTLLGNTDATFEEAKIAAEQAAAQLGYSSADIASVSNAWKAVGVGLSAPACAHDRCATGGALSGACNWCVDAICDVDPYCCTYGWDSICVSEVESVCHSLQCAAAAPACAHTQCTTGAALAASCDSCASTICTVDPYCCNTYWDSICVAEVGSVCGMNCG